MNILFEGVNGSGKTTVINQLRQKFKENGIAHHYIADLETNTPLSPVLRQLFSDNAFLEMKATFKTSLFESLVLAADHHYIQEKFKNKTGLLLYDRDFISVLSYQKDIIKKDYPDDWEFFYTAFRTIMLFQLKKIDLLCYISIPLNDNICRTEERDNRKFSDAEKAFLGSLKYNMEQEIHIYCDKTQTPLLLLDGRISPDNNCQHIWDKLKELSGSFAGI